MNQYEQKLNYTETIKEYDKRLEELRKLEDEVPKDVGEILVNVDQYIFLAERGFTIASKLYTVASYEYTMQHAVYKLVFKMAYLELIEKNTSVTMLKDYAKVKCIDEECKLIVKENRVDIAKNRRANWLEKLNTYKKIKSDNSNIRGAVDNV